MAPSKKKGSVGRINCRVETGAVFCFTNPALHMDEFQKPHPLSLSRSPKIRLLDK